MRQRPVARPLDNLAGRIMTVSRPGLFAAGFVTSSVAAGALVRLLDRIAELQRQLEEAARTDELTGLANRRALFEVLTREIERIRRREGKLSVVFVDIDWFKKVNDRNGHLVGDAVLREAAAAIKGGLRTYDIAGRYRSEVSTAG